MTKFKGGSTISTLDRLKKVCYEACLPISYNSSRFFVQNDIKKYVWFQNTLFFVRNCTNQRFYQQHRSYRLCDILRYILTTKWNLGYMEDLRVILLATATTCECVTAQYHLCILNIIIAFYQMCDNASTLIFKLSSLAASIKWVTFNKNPYTTSHEETNWVLVSSTYS